MSLFSLLAGCSPSITCTHDVDGGELLKSLSNPSTPLETISKNVVQLLSVCKPQKEKLAAIAKAVEQIASMGSASLQAVFYSQLSDSAPKSEARLNFISRSTLISGDVKVTEENLKLVELELLGKEFDRTLASPAIAKVLKEVLPNNIEAAFVRRVETDAGSIVLTRSTSSYRFSEISELRIFDAGTGKRIATPKEEFDYLLDPLNDEPFLDYFFGCASYAGGLCGSRDTRFAIDQSGKLKFIASVLYSDVGDGKCAVNLVTLRVNGQTIQPAPLLSESNEVDCSSPPSPNSHGEPYKVFSESKLLKKLVKLGNYPDVSQLVNFKRKDAADTLIKNRLWAQDDKWKNLLIDNAMNSVDMMGLTTDNPGTDVIKALQTKTERLSSKLDNLQWLSSGTTPDIKTATTFSNIRSEIKSLQQHLKVIESAAPPQVIEEPPNAYRRINVVLQNQLPPQIPAEVAIFAPQNTPFAHFGVVLPSASPAILYSTIPMAYRPRQFNGLLTKSLGIKKYLINGFPQNLLFFQTLSDSEQLDYDGYVEKKKDYQQKLATYKKSQTKLPAKIAEFHVEFFRIEAEAVRVADLMK